MKKIVLTASLLWIVLSAPLYAQTTADTVKLKLDFPLLDVPYHSDVKNATGRNFLGTYAYPSMNQSLALTTNLYSGFHFGMKSFKDNTGMNRFLKNGIYYSGIGLGNYLMLFFPLGDLWLHEEYHRAMYARYGVKTTNPFNGFPFGKTIFPVGNVTIDDIVRLKAENSADFRRKYSAGIEGQYLLINSLQRNNFFYSQGLTNEFQYWLSTVNTVAYFAQSASSKVGGGMLGDMGVWGFDLFNPNVTYAEESLDLTFSGELRSYLKQERNKHLLNFVSPMLFGFKSIPLGKNGLAGNFAIRHLLTPFGTTVSTQIFLKKDMYKMAFAYHGYRNYQHYFPAVEAELIDYPFSVGGCEMYLSPRVIAGAQPKGQEFLTEKAEFLGLLGLRVDFKISQHILPYIDFTAKTKGWVAGNEYLNSNASVKLGLSARF